ncbi:hypothetical protein FOL47_009283 [Perkinsus chesapeaki]|uniref:Uncharacterized protein n=1 Tax=Perkinsus chesapeaki TaxID=330153 RepID=A0A7J6L993_PERCH|nr:hypothetical protein FOL47_009283 [Perkinsus chesapeaki]
MFWFITESGGGSGGYDPPSFHLLDSVHQTRQGDLTSYELRDKQSSGVVGRVDKEVNSYLRLGAPGTPFDDFWKQASVKYPLIYKAAKVATAHIALMLYHVLEHVAELSTRFNPADWDFDIARVPPPVERATSSSFRRGATL